VDGGSLRCSWTATLEPGSSLRVGLAAQAPGEPLFGPGSDRGWDPVVESDDPRVGRVVRRSLGDLQGLLMRDGDDDFLAAGSPWYLTLFGRDSLWAARLLLPVDDGLALPTLRALARRQGTRHDPAIEEEPGKIPHEIRRDELAHLLPPVYYGSVDATALWVCLLADVAPSADEAEVRSLLPALRAALAQLVATSAGSGWLRYVDHTGSGLANQGWKDSPDSVSDSTGRLATPPIALCEVQAYAYEAAVRGQALLGSLGEDPVDGLDEWAASLRARFNESFWVGDSLALALDAHDNPADVASSNVGHVLGTGILDADREARLADLLVSDALSSGFGLRTLTSASPRYAPLSYHNGSVWPHDTAIAVRGLLATGHRRAARILTAGLLRAAEAFEDRVPELYAGDSAREVPSPAAYPASCRPQAWSAAGMVHALWGCQGPGDDLLPAYSIGG
jgi:glycogen debranching enzyme